MSDGWNIRTNKTDRQNEKRVRAIMVSRGIPADRITISDVVRFAMQRTADEKK